MDPSGENDFKVFYLRLENGSGGQEVHGLGQSIVHDLGRVGHIGERDGKVLGVAVVVPENLFSICICIFDSCASI